MRKRRGIQRFFSFISGFSNIDRYQAARSPESEVYVCGNIGVPFVDSEIFREQLYKLDIHCSMGTDGIQP